MVLASIENVFVGVIGQLSGRKSIDVMTTSVRFAALSVLEKVVPQKKQAVESFNVITLNLIGHPLIIRQITSQLFA